jgi:hypothetical protein
MKVLHILRSGPDEETRQLIVAASGGHHCRVIGLFEDSVDHDELIQLLFDADRVFSWW